MRRIANVSWQVAGAVPGAYSDDAPAIGYRRDRLTDVDTNGTVVFRGGNQRLSTTTGHSVDDRGTICRS